MQATDEGPHYLSFSEDRYNGVEAKVSEAAAGASPEQVAAFARELQARVAGWEAAGKGGVWLKIPLACAALAGVGASQGFSFHHAKPDYVLMTRWLLASPSPLPAYAFTQVGVGGVVINTKRQVLMVQERVSPLPIYQGSWKVPLPLPSLRVASAHSARTLSLSRARPARPHRRRSHYPRHAPRCRSCRAAWPIREKTSPRRRCARCARRLASSRRLWASSRCATRTA